MNESEERSVETTRNTLTGTLGRPSIPAKEESKTHKKRKRKLKETKQEVKEEEEKKRRMSEGTPQSKALSVFEGDSIAADPGRQEKPDA